MPFNIKIMFLPLAYFFWFSNVCIPLLRALPKILKKFVPVNFTILDSMVRSFSCNWNGEMAYKVDIPKQILRLGDTKN